MSTDPGAAPLGPGGPGAAPLGPGGPGAAPLGPGAAPLGPGGLGGAGESELAFAAGLGLGPQMAGSFGSGRGPRLLSGGGRKATIISTISTLVVLGGLAAVFWFAPGSAACRHAFFSPSNMWQAFIGDPKKGYYSVGEAIWLNIRMFLAAEVLILILALAVAVVRESTGPVMLSLRVLAMIYVDFFRGVPLLLVVYAIGFGLPALRLSVVSSQSFAVYGVVALT